MAHVSPAFWAPAQPKPTKNTTPNSVSPSVFPCAFAFCFFPFHFAPRCTSKDFECARAQISKFAQGQRDDITDAELWRAQTMLAGEQAAVLKHDMILRVRVRELHGVCRCLQQRNCHTFPTSNPPSRDRRKAEPHLHNGCLCAGQRPHLRRHDTVSPYRVQHGAVAGEIQNR